jgi:hypothetical protein
MTENPMDIDTEWLKTQIELYKTLDDYELTTINKEKGYMDYISEKENEKKLLRVLVDDSFKEAKANAKNIEEILQDIKEHEVDKAIIMAKSISSASRKISRNDKSLKFISNDTKRIYPLLDLMMAIEKKVIELCTIKCGKLPTSNHECEAFNEGKTPCKVRRISDDADFHAEMKWTDMLFEDFSNLVELKINN